MNCVLRPFFILYNVEIPWPKKTGSKIVGGPLWDGGKNKE